MRTRAPVVEERDVERGRHDRQEARQRARALRELHLAIREGPAWATLRLHFCQIHKQMRSGLLGGALHKPPKGFEPHKRIFHPLHRQACPGISSREQRARVGRVFKTLHH